MPTTPEELRLLLSNEEPNYPRIAARLDATAIGQLAELAAGDDVMLASKAVYLASLLPDGAPVVQRAAGSGDAVLRAAAASALRNLDGADANPIAERLLGRGDAAVDKLTLRAIGPDLGPGLVQQLEHLAEASDSAHVRELSQARLDDRN